MYVCKYLSPRAVYSRSTRTWLHARACTPTRKSRPSHMLTSLLPQRDSTPLESASNDEVKTAFAEHAAKSG